MDNPDFLELPDDSIREIVSVFNRLGPYRGAGKPGTHPLWEACTRVAMEQGVDLSGIAAPRGSLSTEALLDYLTNRAHLRFRPVVLPPGWFRKDHGPLLAFTAEGKQPVAIVPDKHGHYQLVQFNADKVQPVTHLTQQAASGIVSLAYAVHRPLPDRAVKRLDLLRFGFQGLGGDVRRLVYAVMAANVLGLALPVSIGFIFDGVIPNANFSMLGHFVLGLAVVSICTVLFFVAERITSNRLELKMTAAVQAAVWDRLLRLPVPFFRKFSGGDLSDRAAGIDEIQRTLSANALGVLLGGAFSVLSLALMFYYSVSLALGAVALTLVYIAINALASIRQLKFQRSMQEAQGRNYGFLLQMLNGLIKLRVAGKMENAFRIWLANLVRIKRLYMRAERARIQLSAVSAVYSVLLVAILFGMVATIGRDLSLGAFMAFNAAYSYFFASILAMSGVIADSLEIVPTYERAACILDTPPEQASTGSFIGALKGEIELAQVSFDYGSGRPNGPDQHPGPVIDTLEMHLAPGEFVGLVGPSGCGKSTLFRLLLGFERPSSGKILFDGRDLIGIDPNSLRKRVGVVLQHGQLSPGTLLENILAGEPALSEDDAWAAAQLACVDTDIEAMPMGMHTFVSEGGRNLSVGQRQRVLIARAFARQPAVLFLDEATSAIDNQVQARLVENIQAFGATCILSSHRLATVQDAARVFVLDKGRIVQQGTYETLIAESGPFAALAGQGPA